ncbi:hypothetical protein BC332_03435 [Capsicum chinense]|nr:hypothetical protein BC332_03435 [Capsicum chinense]
MWASACSFQAVNDNDVDNIVMSYLVHNYFTDTLESFIASTGMQQPASRLEDIEERKTNSNLPSYSAVERLMQQTTIVRQCLSQESSKFGSAQFDLCSLEGGIYAPSELCMSTLPLFHCSYRGEIEGCSSIPAIHYLCGSAMTYGEF